VGQSLLESLSVRTKFSFFSLFRLKFRWGLHVNFWINLKKLIVFLNKTILAFSIPFMVFLKFASITLESKITVIQSGNQQVHLIWRFMLEMEILSPFIFELSHVFLCWLFNKRWVLWLTNKVLFFGKLGCVNVHGCLWLMFGDFWNFKAPTFLYHFSRFNIIFHFPLPMEALRSKILHVILRLSSC